MFKEIKLTLTGPWVNGTDSSFTQAMVGVDLTTLGPKPYRNTFSGVHIGNGIIATVHHGIREVGDRAALSVQIRKNYSVNPTPFYGQAGRGYIEQEYPGLDLALLAIPNYPQDKEDYLEAVPIAENSEMQIGKQLACGTYYPRPTLRPCWVFASEVQPEEINPYERSYYPSLVDHLYQIFILGYTVKVGDSGSGVFNYEGQLVGLIVAAKQVRTTEGIPCSLVDVVNTDIIKR